MARTISRGRILEAFGERRCVSNDVVLLTINGLSSSATDLWQLPHDLLTSSLSAEVEHNFYARCPPDNRPDIHHVPTASDEKSDVSNDREKQQSAKRSRFDRKPKTFKTDEAGKTQYDSSLIKALHRTFFVPWWTAGLLKLFAGAFGSFVCIPSWLTPRRTDTLKTTTPLVNKVILTWLTNSYVWYRLTDAERAAGVIAQPQGIGYGVGLAFALFAMQRTSIPLLRMV